MVRGPAALAKAAAALDLVSGGHLVLGVGPGSSWEDYTLAGVPFEDRWPRFEAAEFDAWVARQTGPAPEISDSLTPLAARGKQAFVTGGCIGCHAMAGQPTERMTAMLGPNLSHVGSRGSLAGNMLANTDENLARWIRDPQAVKHGSLMKLPRELTDDEVQALVAYLRLHQ